MSGDFQLEDTIFIPFTTRQFSDGVPTTLLGTPVVTGHRDANLTQFTTGITLDVDFDAIAGLNMITVVATAANAYVAGETYTLYLSAGTVGGVSVVGEVVGHFTLDMSAAALDLANGTDGLGAIKTETALIVGDTNELQGDWLNGGRLDLILDARMAEASINTTGGAVDTVTTLTGHTAQTGDSFVRLGAAGVSLTDLGGMSTGMQAEVQTEANDALVANNLDHFLLTATGIPASVAGTYYDQLRDDGTAVFDRTTDSLQAIRDTAPLGTAMRGTDSASTHAAADVWATDATGDNVAVDVVAVKAETALIVADTNELQTDDYPTTIAAIQSDTDDIQTRLPTVLVGGRMDATVDATGMETGAVDNILTRQMTQAYAADGTAPTLAQALFLIQQMLGDFSISGTTLTVREIDGLTTAATFTLDDGTNPTDLTRAT